MLYLAEVLRKTRVIGAGKAEFKLLACQRSEQSWSAVPGEEIVSAPDDVSYGAGVLVMLELTAGKQVQRHVEAGRQLVSILQNFSRLQEKAKTQEEEIEQWKQSLTYQSQELNRREMEMEARQEQLQEIEEDLQRLEQQRQEIEAAREGAERLREEFERRSQELEGAWAQLRGAESRLEERQTELQQASVLDEEQAGYLQGLLSRISEAVAPTELIQEQLNSSFAIIAQQQSTLDHHWQNLEQQRTSAQQLQEDADRHTQDLHSRWQAWYEAQQALEQAQAGLQAKRDALQLNQDYAQTLSSQLQNQDALYQQVAQLSGSSDKVDTEALEKLSLEDLQTTVRDLETDLEKLSRFVHSQEEELALQQKDIDALRQQIQQASEYDRLRLETELADEQDRYQMLNQTLVGQRRNLHERQAVLKQHQLFLARRQGYPTDDLQDSSIDLTPILTQIDRVREQLTHELQTLQAQIQQLQQAIEQTQTAVTQQATEQDATRHELKQLDQQGRSQIAAAAELWGKVNTYQETLQPLQDAINELRQKTEAVASTMTQFQEANGYQLQAISEMRTTIDRLVGNQAAELAAS